MWVENKKNKRWADTQAVVGPPALSRFICVRRVRVREDEQGGRYLKRTDLPEKRRVGVFA